MVRAVSTAAGVAAALVVAGVALAVDQVAFPTTQPVAAASVIVVLGPPGRPGEQSTAAAVARISSGAQVLVSDPGGLPCPRIAAGQICFVPAPSTTEGEARYGTTWARDHHRSSVTVIAPTYQVSRARLWFRRCWAGRLAVVAAPVGLGARLRQVPYQTAGFLKAEIFERRC